MTAEGERLFDHESVDLAKGIIYDLNLTENQTLKTISILQSLSPYADFAPIYCQSFTLAVESLGIKVPIQNLCTNLELETVIVNRVVSFNNPTEKIVGIKRGLSHGFHRSITLPQIIESAIKADDCDEHIWFLESDWRISFYKHKNSLNNENQRLVLALVSGMADKVGLIEGIGYSNDFYRNIINLWQPDVYFINESSGVNVIKEAEYRAKLVGCELRVIQEIGKSHTSDFEKALFNKSLIY